MICHQCSQSAIGVCKFCGRAVCTNHVSQKPCIFSVYVGRNQTPKVIAVADALWCGQCKVQPEPIPMPEIY